MPLFEFECSICHTKTEVIQKFDDEAPLCASDDMHLARMDRLVSVPRRAIFKTGCTGAQLHDRTA